jgi:hypothetical protein
VATLEDSDGPATQARSEGAILALYSPQAPPFLVWEQALPLPWFETLQPHPERQVSPHMFYFSTPDSSFFFLFSQNIRLPLPVRLTEPSSRCHGIVAERGGGVEI